MDNPQGKNVPDAHYERLRRHTCASLAMLRVAESVWLTRPKTDLAVEAAALLQEERSRRDMEIG